MLLELEPNNSSLINPFCGLHELFCNKIKFHKRIVFWNFSFTPVYCIVSFWVCMHQFYLTICRNKTNSAGLSVSSRFLGVLYKRRWICFYCELIGTCQCRMTRAYCLLTSLLRILRHAVRQNRPCRIDQCRKTIKCATVNRHTSDSWLNSIYVAFSMLYRSHTRLINRDAKVKVVGVLCSMFPRCLNWNDAKIQIRLNTIHNSTETYIILATLITISLT